MKQLRLLLAAALLALSVAAFAQDNTPPTVKVTFPKKAQVGGTVSGTIELTFADGLHGYQNPPTEEYAIPVVVKVEGKEYKLGKVKYPLGVMKVTGGADKPIGVYEGTIRIPVTLTAPKKVGASKFTLTISYQQCNEQSCYAPSAVSQVVKLNVVKKAK